MKKIKGVVPPMITPFKKNGDLDVENLKKLIRFLKNEVDGLFITGSYGSGALMNLEERMKVAEITSEILEGKIPFITMVGTTNNRDSVELAKHSERSGATAVAATGPYYYKHNKEDLMRFYTDLIESVSIPVYLYNNPKFQGYEISLSTIKELKKIGLRGIKDATFDILVHANYHRVLKDNEFDIVLGTEAMWLAARTLGCEAFIPGLANVFPEINRKMYKEGMCNNIEACRETQFMVNRIREIMYLARSTQLAVYAMLDIRGIVKCYPRAPFVEATGEEKKKIKVELKKIKMI
ncbi:MAG: dihydrodipicolinate synthase family protein [Actinomycetota bacterium]|nr:dihydrodipicolinate synthase family protein [Actinomycetota bacterium]